MPGAPFEGAYDFNESRVQCCRSSRHLEGRKERVTVRNKFCVIDIEDSGLAGSPDAASVR